MAAKDERRAAIARIVRGARPATQQALAELLIREGYEATQATVSRDVTEMGMVKGSAGYLTKDEACLVRLLADLVVSVGRAQNLVVVKSLPGGAQGVAAAIDAAGIGQTLGSIAGDDTILVIAADDEEARRFVDELETYRTM